MATQNTPQAPEQAFDWDAFLGLPDPEREAIVDAEGATRALWLSQDPGTPIADGLAYLEELDRPARQAAAAKALGIPVEALVAMLAAASKPAKSERKGSGRSSNFDMEAAREYIEAELEQDRKVPKYDVIRAYRKEVGPVNQAEWDEIWSELSGR